MSSQQMAKLGDAVTSVAGPKSSLPESLGLDGDAPEAKSSRPTDGKPDEPDGAQTVRVVITVLVSWVAMLVSITPSRLVLCRHSMRSRYTKKNLKRMTDSMYR